MASSRKNRLLAVSYLDPLRLLREDALLPYAEVITVAMKKIISVGPSYYKNSSGDEIANVNFFYNIARVEASAYAH